MENEFENLIEDQGITDDSQDDVLIKKSCMKEAEDDLRKAELKREERKRERIKDS